MKSVISINILINNVRSMIKPILTIILYGLFLYSPISAQAQISRNIPVYNLEAGIGLKGYDPVSYFPEGGGNPLPGDSDISLNFEGVIYLFSNTTNRDQFMENPGRYEPTYGGWCAYAMASGSTVDIQPMIFTINGNRLHFFVSHRAKRNFDSDILGFETRADEFWRKISGEDPRK